MRNFNYLKTNHVSIYKNSYWGNHSMDDELLSNGNIIKNRNKFITNYNIINYVKRPPPYLNKELDDFQKPDHREIYKTLNNYIIVVSVYHFDFNERSTKWNKINSLYSCLTRTYIKVITKRSEHKYLMPYANKISNWYYKCKRNKVLWRIAEYYTIRKYSPENALQFINLQD